MGVIADVCGRAGGVSAGEDVAATTPTLPPSVPSTLTLTPLQPPTSGASISLGSTHPGVWSGGNGMLESFEVSAMAQEAEDRLAQFTMDEELSDARLGGLEEEMEGFGETRLGGVEQEMGGFSYQDSHTAGSGDRLSVGVLELRWKEGVGAGGGSSMEPKWEEGVGAGGVSSVEPKWEEYKGVAGRARDNGAMVTRSETTCDPEERERLERSMSVPR